jgi:hypothetical protein
VSTQTVRPEDVPGIAAAVLVGKTLPQGVSVNVTLSHHPTIGELFANVTVLHDPTEDLALEFAEALGMTGHRDNDSDEILARFYSDADYHVYVCWQRDAKAEVSA